MGSRLYILLILIAFTKALPTPKGFLPAAPHVSPASELSAMRVAHMREQSGNNISSDILNSDDEESLEDDSDYDDEVACVCCFCQNSFHFLQFIVPVGCPFLYFIILYFILPIGASLKMHPMHIH